MIRYQPPATNLTVPTSAAYGENVTPGAVTGEDREQELWRRQVHVSCIIIIIIIFIFLFFIFIIISNEHN